jgi:hypothetical protein
MCNLYYFAIVMVIVLLILNIFVNKKSSFEGIKLSSTIDEIDDDCTEYSIYPLKCLASKK